MDSNEKLRPMKLSGNLAENWKSWIQRFEIYSTATELDGKDQKIQCAQMLHHMGEDAINIFNSFTFADNEKNKIASLKEKFANYFVPKTNVTYERYKFFTSRQNEEPLEQFITNLKNQAQLCNLGEEALRNELIKTMLIIGIKDEAVREKLLQKEDLTLDKAIECCIVTESSRQQLRDMKQNTSSQSQGVNEIDSIRRTTRTMESNSRANKETKSRFDNKDQFKKVSNCTRCGKNHSINNCSAYGALCNNCKKPNHFANVCKYKSHRNRKINEIVDHDNYEQSLLINEISNNSKINNCTIELIVNNKVNVFVNFKVDTGANANIISLDQLKSIEFNEKSIQRSHEILLTFTGKCYLHLRLKDKLIKNVEFHIHKGNGSIIGINACVELDIIKFHEEVKLKEIYAINKNCNSGYEKLINDNSNLFKGIGKVGRPYHIELNENAMPVVKPIRNVPFAIQEQFKKHLNELVNLKIIERVEGSSEWVNSYVIVRKNNGSLRICLDPKNLNESIKDSKYKLTSLDDIISNINGSTIHLIYKPGKDLIIADTLSRANSSKTFDDNLDLEAQVCLIQKKLIITDNRVAQLVKEVSKDEELQSIKKYVVNGWPSISKIPSNIKPYHKLKAEITLVDYYSKFPEISNLQKNLTSSNIINKLKAIFARHGIPKIVVSDSAKQFTGIEFQNFSKQWNFLSIKSSPHHQQSNGQTERTIQTIKKLIKKSTENNEDIYLALLAFRNTPVYNSYTPSQILMSRYLRDNLLIIDSKLNPKLINNTKLNQKISNSQSYNKKQYDSKGVRPRQDFKIGTAVWYQLKPKSLWEKGKIVDKLSNTTYKVQTLDDSHQNVISNKDSDHSKPSVSASDERSKRQIRLPPALNDYVLYK
ncbi:hypothetical protein PPYR_15607 [Photinus pyralis]|uniref:Integrase catalytic domain-containing protein n=1 Tax=Photinus pyralis TaxID=7054 RepID=A0A5N3ZYD5_PHOPY|nr:hypothetical protein PPYR_15607 [Photinus pyralis]